VWTGVEDDENGIRGGSYVACSLRCYFFFISSWIGRLGAWTAEVEGGGGRHDEIEGEGVGYNVTRNLDGEGSKQITYILSLPSRRYHISIRLGHIIDRHECSEEASRPSGESDWKV